MSADLLQRYEAFLASKMRLAEGDGFPCEPWEVNPLLKPHQRDIVCWAVRGGRRAIFAAFGLGKSIIQLEVVRLVLAKAGAARGLKDGAGFWQQMDFLTPQLLRVLAPGRLAAIHVKDRIAPGGLTGFGFQTVQPFHAEAIDHYTRHGFAYLGMKTVVTDVVRENNQTYRLGWTEQCKDGSRMGCGMPEYVLLFRKPPTDRSDGYADVPVVKQKAAYALARWQLDAHGFQRSSGDRLLSAEDLAGVPHHVIYKLFRRSSLSSVYDYEQHVALTQSLGERLPVTFMLMPPHSWHPDVWTDVARMRTLNMDQERKGREQHLCPLQFDIVDRLIVQHSMEGETVYDPFGGLMTVVVRALKLKRQGVGSELSPTYWADGVNYCAAAEREAATPSLFDLDAVEDGQEVA